MKTFKKKVGFFYKQSFLRYLFVGVSTIVLDVAILAFLKEILNFKLEIAASISYWLSIAYNFTMNRWWTFSAQEAKSVAEHAVLYISLLIFNYFYTIVAVRFLSSYIHYSLAKVIIILAATTWTYPLYKRFIFKKNPA
jgi:putative flippase GtrA